MLASTSSSLPASAYVHIPFCRRRCYYCDFPISVVGDRPPQSRQSQHPASKPQFGAIVEYLKILLQEIQITPDLGQPLQTLFFGGGTPSLLTADQLATVINTLNDQFGIAASAEISVEMDPGTFDLAQLHGYRLAGVNRVSLGVQAFQAELLAACGRTQTPEDIDAAVAMLRQAGITNFSLDLISGLPHQTLDQWQESLERAIALNPTHLSIYDLTIEPMTAFSRWYQPGRSPLPSDDITAQMYKMAQQVLTTDGYDHYEISNYARPGYHCRHNRVYWENRPYYGFGMGAASYIQGQRLNRPRTRSEYYAWVDERIAQADLLDYPVTPPDEILLETLMLGLRLTEGLSLEALFDQFGEQSVQMVLQALTPYFNRKWATLLRADHRPVEPLSLQSNPANPAKQSKQGEQSDGDIPHSIQDWSGYRICLTDPDGFLFSNVVLSDVFKLAQHSNLQNLIL
jgi:putative oxygen-independent coproporphyrinogen III oxidase